MTTDARALIRLTADEAAQLRHHIADHRVTCSYSCHLIERLLTGYTAALDEVDRLRKFEPAVAQRFLDLNAANAEINRLTADLAASRAINRHFEQERDSWGEAYKQRAAQTDKRIAELEAEVERIRSAVVKFLAAVNDSDMVDFRLGWIHDGLTGILEGAPCTTK
jgi:DNA anti-recombination protein RmuC